jgi:hypothetical protein
MAKYSVAVTHAPDRSTTVKAIRAASILGVADITSRLGTLEPIAEFDTWDFPLDMGHAKGVPYQQKRILEFLATLQDSGATAVVSYHAGVVTEIVSTEMLRNLFERQLQSLAQQHD